MDWCVDTRVSGASGLAESEIAAHLARHAIEPGVVELARVTVHQLLGESPPGSLWVTLDWTDQQSRLILRPAEELVGTPVGPGVTRANEEARDLVASWNATRDHGSERIVELGVARTPERDIDPPPAPSGWLPAVDTAHLLGLISGEVERGHSFQEAAARGGATVAALVHPGRAGDPPDLVDMAGLLIDTEQDLGADFEIVEADQRRVVVRNRRCPFGPSTGRHMCRFTSALAGSLAARSSGRADVSLVESLAAGDHECRLVLDLQDGLDPKVAHRYHWPPESSEPADVLTSDSRGFQVTLSLQLPRDRLSVPITRHLIRAAMDEVGVVTDDADAVDLAVTEACANVIDHSGPGDAYDVAVSISPSACHIRVVDVGRGFDHQALSLSRMASQDAEHGRGVALMHALVDQVRFESEPEKGTVVHLVKRLEFEPDAAAHKLMGETRRETPTD